MFRPASTAPSLNARRMQQHRVAARLDEIAARRRRLYALKAWGARPAGLRTLKTELAVVREELAEATARGRPSEQGIA